MYHRSNSKDDCLMSPPMDPVMRLLTPRSPYSMDVRRNSDVSALSLSSSTTCPSDYSTPATPMYTQSPLATQSLNTSAFNMSHVHGTPMKFEPKSASFDEHLTNSWVLLDNTDRMDHTTSAIPHNMYASHGFQLETQTSECIELQNTAIAMTQPWYHTSQYTNLDSHLDMAPNLDIDLNTNMLHLHPATPMHSLWDVRAQPMLELDATTIVPHNYMLGGDYVHVDTPDPMDDSYDDVDVPFEQHAAFKQESMSPLNVKQETEVSDNEGRPRRSICETRTGGKSVKVKKEQRRSRITKVKTEEQGGEKKRRSKCKSKYGDSVWELNGDTVLSNWNSVYQDTDQKWRSTKAPEQKFICKYPYNDDEIVPEGKSFCGRQFKRTEHHVRHKNTHKAIKDYPCLLCKSRFNRNDNRWAHGWTHVRQSGKGDGRNWKFSLRQVISVLPDPKHIEMLLKKWAKDVGTNYIPEDEEDDSLEFVAKMRERNKDLNEDQNFSYDANMAVWKIRSHRLTHLVDSVSVS